MMMLVNFRKHHWETCKTPVTKLYGIGWRCILNVFLVTLDVLHENQGQGLIVPFRLTSNLHANLNPCIIVCKHDLLRSALHKLRRKLPLMQKFFFGGGAFSLLPTTHPKWIDYFMHQLRHFLLEIRCLGIFPFSLTPQFFLMKTI